MAAYIKNVTRSKDQELIKTWIQQRFLTSRTKLSLPAKRPAVHLKSTKPTFTQWNNYLELRKGIDYSSTASFHHLATNFLIYDVAYITNTATRHFAKDNKDLPSLDTLDSHLGGINDFYAKGNLEKEMSRLRRTGAMTDIPNKIPEGIQGIKGEGPQGDKKL